MPMATKEAQLKYQREWMARRRKEWFDANGPCVDCGATEQLELDHVDAALKVSHRIWSWTKDRREAELSKCVVRCVRCHDQKTLVKSEYSRGIAHGRSKLGEAQVLQLRRAYAAGENVAELGRQLGVTRDTANKAARGLTWKHLDNRI